MEELLAALASLKDNLKCGYCKELPKDAFVFKKCSHLFCSKHISEGKLKYCFTCHEGSSQDVIQSSTVTGMIKDFENLEEIFVGKENVEQSDIVTTPVKPQCEKDANVKVVTRQKRTDPLNYNCTEPHIIDPPKLPSGHSRAISTRNKKKQSSSPEKSPVSNDTNKAPVRILRNKAKKEKTVTKPVEKLPLTKGPFTELAPVSQPSCGTRTKSPIKHSKTPFVLLAAPNVVKTRSESVALSKTTTKQSSGDSSPNKIHMNATRIKNKGETQLHLATNSKDNDNSESAPPAKIPTKSDDNSLPDKSPINVKKNVTRKNKGVTVAKTLSRASGDDSFSEKSSSILRRNTTKRNNKGETPLHSACVRRKVEMVTALLQAGADPNTRDHAGWTPLHDAVIARQVELVRKLLAHGALPSPPGQQYLTPLHEAVRLQLSDIVLLLLNAGASLEARDDHGRTPLDLADEQMLKLLQKPPSSAEFSKVKICYSESPIICVLAHGLTKEHTTKLLKLAKQHEDLKVEMEMSKSVTHVLVKECTVNPYTLFAVAGARKVITLEWLDNCSQDTIADTKQYEIKSLGSDDKCIELSIENSINLKPGLFDGCNFFFLGFSKDYEISAHLSVRKPYLCKLVEEAGGVVLKREPDPEAIGGPERPVPYHAPRQGPLQHCAHFIIYENRPQLAYNMRHLRSLPVAWLVRCLETFRWVDP